MPNTARLILETVAGEGLRFRASTGSGQQTLVDSGRPMIAPSPTELLLVSLAGCMAMDVIAIMRKKRQQVSGYEIDIQGERRADPPRSFTRIDIVHRLFGTDLSREAAERSIELSMTKYCSVGASLDPAIEVTNRVELASVGAAGGAPPNPGA